MKINFRAFLFVLVCAAAGVLFSLVAFYAMPLGVALLTAQCAGVTALGVRACLRRDYVKLAAFVLALAVTVYLAIAFFVTLDVRRELADGGRYTVTGRVTEHFHYDAGDNVFFATLDDLRADGRAVGGKLRLRVAGPTDECFAVACGTRLAVETEVHRSQLIDERGVHAEYIRTDMRYSATCTGADIFAFAPGQPRPLESARLAVKERLLANMGEDAGRVAYGMIAGDKYLLDEEIRAAYAATGIGHILAVSGLHIGLIAFTLMTLLGFLPLPRNVSRALLTFLLLAYVLFAGGSPSAVRAFVMCAAGVWAPLFGRRDGLNSLCLAATVCLCVSPFYFFECGWITSVAAVFGLVLLSRPLQNLLMRLRVPRKIASPVAASLAVQLTIVPTLAFFFHRFNFWAFFVNAFALTALSAFFVAMAACLPFAMLPPLGFLLKPFGIAIGALNQFCFLVSSLPLAACVLQVSAAVFLLLPLTFGMSRFVILRHKRLFNAALFGLCVAIAVVSENSVRYDDALLAVGGHLAVTVVYDEDARYLISGFARDVVRQVDDSRVGGGDFIVYGSDLDVTATENILRLAAVRDVKEVRVPYGCDLTGAEKLRGAGVKTKFVTDGDGAFSAVYKDGVFSGWLYASGGKSAYITDGEPDGDASAAADVVRCARAGDNGNPFAEYLTAPYGSRPVLYDFKTGKSVIL